MMMMVVMSFYGATTIIMPRYQLMAYQIKFEYEPGQSGRVINQSIDKLISQLINQTNSGVTTGPPSCWIGHWAYS